MEVRVYRLGERMEPKHTLWTLTGRYTERFYTPGDFELVLPLSDESSADAIVKGDIVQIDGRFWAQVENRRISRSGGESRLRVTGRTMVAWFERRIIIPGDAPPRDAPLGYDSIRAATETIIKHYATNSLASPENMARSINQLSIAPDMARGIAEDACYARFDNLMELLGRLGERANLGLRVMGNLRTGRFTLDVAEGADRTIRQRINRPLVFDISRGTLENLEFVEDYTETANTFYATRSGAEFEDEALTQTYYMDEESTAGLERQERHIDVSVDTDGETFEDMEYGARKEMEQYRPKISCTASTSGLVYMPWEDYRAGDYVTIRDTMAKLDIDRQIYELETAVEPDTVRYKLGFGQPQLTKFEIARRA